MRLLVVSEWFPYPPIAGAKIRAYYLLRQLSRLAEVDLIAQVRTLTPEQTELGKSYMTQYCRTVQSVSGVPYIYSYNRALRTVADPVPPAVRYSRNLPLEDFIKEKWQHGDYDAVVATISGYPSSTLYSLVNLGLRPLIADSLELGVMRPKHDQGPARRIRTNYTWRRMRQFAKRLLKDVDYITVTSEKEAELFQDLQSHSDQIIVMPNVLDLEDYEDNFGSRDYRVLMYAGSFGYAANYEAMLWFTKEVFREITCREKLRVQVTGNTANRDLAPLEQACPQIEFTGFVDDIRPYFAKSGICIVPILSGGSTRLKIIEAMAWGTPVVSTLTGAEGLNVTDGKNILLADSPASFARAIDLLIEDQELWQKISKGGRNLVEREYSANRMYGQWHDLLSGMILAPLQK